MNIQLLKEEWLKNEQINFSGWDFSALDGECEEERTPWSYRTIVREHMSEQMELLDMGTGGGEFLLTLNHPYGKTAVTEGWEPNVALLKKKVVPLGVKLAFVGADDCLAYPDNRFDIVLNRHESFSVSEVKRVLKPNGIFITQQVGERNGKRLADLLLGDHQPAFEGLNLRNTVEELEGASFEIVQAEEFFPDQTFFSMKALIYYVKVIEWEYPHFSVDVHFDGLVKAYKELTSKGFVLNNQHRFLTVARNVK
ncbi:methyltransferase [Bacillus sp. JCM 19046]|nr:methyltransferase [Bacillus sp. JCM 19045]GAF17409.1 methyltransferase [Bacillus sp. JCM 19046]